MTLPWVMRACHPGGKWFNSSYSHTEQGSQRAAASFKRDYPEAETEVWPTPPPKRHLPKAAARPDPVLAVSDSATLRAHLEAQRDFAFLYLHSNAHAHLAREVIKGTDAMIAILDGSPISRRGPGVFLQRRVYDPQVPS